MTKDDMVLFTRYGMGDAPLELQEKLAGIFLSMLNQDSAPGVIAFYGEGVKLTCLESPVLQALQTLAEKGSRLIVCQTCLDYYKLRDRVRIGIIGGMGDIVHAMNAASKVVSV
jgi:hypothetical protein